MMSQHEAQWQAPAVTHLVVKHGFLEEPKPMQAPGAGLSRRFASDSALWMKGFREENSFDEPLEVVGESQYENMMTSSGSDNETDVVGLPKPAEFTSFGHVRVKSGSDTAASDSTGVDISGERPPSPGYTDKELWSCMLGSGESTPTRDSMSDMERLLAENARLALENQRLQQQCMGKVHVAQVPASMPIADKVWPDTVQGNNTGNQDGSYQMNFVPAQQGMVWVPFMMAPQVTGQVQVPTQMTWCNMPVANCATAPQGQPAQGKQESLYRKTGPMQMGCRSGGGGGESFGTLVPPSHVQRRMNGQRDMLEDDKVTDVKLEDRTTVMLRNLPNNYSRKMLLDMMDSEGFAGQYDFVYFPIDFRTHASLGYAFINLDSPSIVPRFWSTFDGYTNWALPSRKECFVSWCGPHQGYEAHVQRYRSSPVMHPVVPDEYKPVIFKNGVRVEFPPPGKKPRIPRVRNYVRGSA
mmetsp:Transcript_96551/g.251620  ORF Transcript_96551/g.251620 Transcript_96551/m.251620 type:complete len:467 (+) Transcript_96551:97-1497(+)